MNHFFLEQDSISIDKMPHEGQGFSLTDAISFPEFIEVGFEISILTKLEDDVQMFTTPEAVIHFDNERRRQWLESGDLALDLFFDVVCQLVDIYVFDCDFHAIVALSKEDLSTCTLSQGMRF